MRFREATDEDGVPQHIGCSKGCHARQVLLRLRGADISQVRQYINVTSSLPIRAQHLVQRVELPGSICKCGGIVRHSEIEKANIGSLLQYLVKLERRQLEGVSGIGMKVMQVIAIRTRLPFRHIEAGRGKQNSGISGVLLAQKETHGA